MTVFDAHCDTLSKLLEEGGCIRSNSYHVDIDRMMKYEGFVQFFACFVPPSINYSQSFDYVKKLIELFYTELKRHNDDMILCSNYADIIHAIESGRVASLLSVEDGVALQGNLDNLKRLYSFGVRSICLSWNHGNDIAGGVDQPGCANGLSGFGRSVVKEMNKMGMIIDVSHISEKAFWDVIELSTQPVIASHSNCKKVFNHRRNLTDEQIKAISQLGGVIGINMCPEFLGNNKPGLKEIVAHIEYVISISGEETIGFGCDFDGISDTPLNINGVQDIGLIIETLLKMNYRDETVKKICCLNFLRVIKNVLK